MTAQPFSFAVWQDVPTEECLSGKRCFGNETNLAVSQSDAQSCAQSKYGAGYTFVPNTFCNMGDCQ
jgi:hypothetical protein